MPVHVHGVAWAGPQPAERWWLPGIRQAPPLRSLCFLRGKSQKTSRLLELLVSIYLFTIFFLQKSNVRPLCSGLERGGWVDMAGMLEGFPLATPSFQPRAPEHTAGSYGRLGLPVLPTGPTGLGRRPCWRRSHAHTQDTVRSTGARNGLPSTLERSRRGMPLMGKSQPASWRARTSALEAETR